jgi:hypothetical protein
MQRCTCAYLRRFSTSATAQAPQNKFDLGGLASNSDYAAVVQTTKPRAADPRIRSQPPRPRKVEPRRPPVLPRTDGPATRPAPAPRKELTAKTPDATPSPAPKPDPARPRPPQDDVYTEPALEKASRTKAGGTRREKEQQLKMARGKQSDQVAPRRAQPAPLAPKRPIARKAKTVRAVKNIEVPSMISVANLALLLKVKQCALAESIEYQAYGHHSSASAGHARTGHGQL